MPRRDPIQDALRRELEALGVGSYHFVRPRRGHPRVVVDVPGGRLQVVYPSTSSDRRSVDNCLACLRRLVRRAQAADTEASASASAVHTVR